MGDDTAPRRIISSTVFFIITIALISLFASCHNTLTHEHFRKDLQNHRPHPSAFGTITINATLLNVGPIQDSIPDLEITLATDKRIIARIPATSLIGIGNSITFSKGLFYDYAEEADSFYFGYDTGDAVNNFVKETSSSRFDFYSEERFIKIHTMNPRVTSITASNSYTQPLILDGTGPTKISGLEYEAAISHSVFGILANETSTALPINMPNVAPGVYDILVRATIPTKGYYGEWNVISDVELL